MLDKKLKEALELLGGKAILKDENDYFVVLTLKEFKKIKQEGISGLTKQELVDRINNDIAIWQSSQEEANNEKIDLETMAKNEIGTEEEVHYEKA